MDFRFQISGIRNRDHIGDRKYGLKAGLHALEREEFGAAYCVAILEIGNSNPKSQILNWIYSVARGIWVWLDVCILMKRQRVTNYYLGHVQGVGFRYRVKNLANGFEVTGNVRNLDDGRVELIAEGARGELEEFLVAIRESEVGRFIRNEQTDWSEAKNEFRGFDITR